MPRWPQGLALLPSAQTPETASPAGSSLPSLWGEVGPVPCAERVGALALTLFLSHRGEWELQEPCVERKYKKSQAPAISQLPAWWQPRGKPLLLFRE